MSEHPLIRIMPVDDILLGIDPLPTFMTGGGLGIRGGEAIIPVANQVLIPRFSRSRRMLVVDTHPHGHISLQSSYRDADGNPIDKTVITVYDVLDGSTVPADHALFTKFGLIEQLRQLPGHKMRLWPDHGIVGTREAEPHPDLDRDAFTLQFPKGMDPMVDSYSAFRDNKWQSTHLGPLLKSMDVKRVFLWGLAFDYCVGFSAEDAVLEGFEAYIITDATRSVDIPAEGDWPGSVAVMNERLRKAGVHLITSDQLYV